MSCKKVSINGINMKHLFLFVFFSLTMYSQDKQSKVDSLWLDVNNSNIDTVKINTYFKLTTLYKNSDLKKTDSLSNIIFNLSKKNNFLKGFGYYYFNLSFIEKPKGDLKKHLDNFNKSKYYFNKQKNKALYLECILQIAFCYMDMKMPEKGKDIAIQTLGIYEKSNYYRELSRLNYFLGVYYENVNHDDDKAFYHFNKANYYAKIINDFRSLYNCYSQIILIYFKQENWEKALYYSEISKKYLNSIEMNEGLSNEFLLSNNLSYLSKSNHYLKRYLVSLSQSKKALELGEKNKENPTIRFNLVLISLNYYYLGNYSLSVKYAKAAMSKYAENTYISNHIIGMCYYKKHNYLQAKNILKSTINKYQDLVSTDEYFGPYTLYKDLSAVYVALKDHKSANFYLEQYGNKTIAKLVDENKSKINEYAEKFNSRNLELENKMLLGAKKKKELELALQKNKIYLSNTISIFLLILFSIITFFFLKIKRNNKLLIYHEKELLNSKELLNVSLYNKELLLKEIHHRVKNNLQLIISLQNIQFRRNKHDTIINFLAKGQNRINAMALIHESLYQNNNIEKVDISYYLTQLIQYIQNIETNKKVNFNISIKKIEFYLETALPLGLIINELITNSYKHAFTDEIEGTINITIEDLLENEYKLLYNDTGIPFVNKTNQPEKFGIELVQLLIKQLKGEIVFFNKEKKEYLMVFNTRGSYLNL